MRKKRGNKVKEKQKVVKEHSYEALQNITTKSWPWVLVKFGMKVPILLKTIFAFLIFWHSPFLQVWRILLIPEWSEASMIAHSSIIYFRYNTGLLHFLLHFQWIQKHICCEITRNIILPFGFFGDLNSNQEKSGEAKPSIAPTQHKGTMH